ncbi:MAG: HlyD family efflux transporter periplasmic adaptor subunit [Desulfobulbaceae bacterium]|nr:MAG: HlyD family efflux transporter periplasmic adaptor subunit [Desulfobulbaceae bacterium]
MIKTKLWLIGLLVIGLSSSLSAKETIVFEGKVFYALKRTVVMPFGGKIISVAARAGEAVTQDEVVVRYRIDQNRAAQIGRELLFEELDDLRRYLETEKLKVVHLRRKEQELVRLTEEKLSPPYALERVRMEMKVSLQFIEVLEGRISHVRNLAEKKLAYLRIITGNPSLKSGDIPDRAVLSAPISGVVLSVHPLLVVNSEIPEGTPVFSIGAADTIVVRSLVYERDVVKMKPGDTVTFFPDSLPESSFSAQISAINYSPVSSDPDKPSYYQVEMAIQNEAVGLREGFKGRVEYVEP